MKIEGYQRKQIKSKKEEEKKQAESELFRDLDEMEHRNQMLLEQKQEAERLRKLAVEKAEKSSIENREQVMKGKTINASQTMIDRDIYKEDAQKKSGKNSGDIWGDDDEIETIPSSSQSRPTTSGT